MSASKGRTAAWLNRHIAGLGVELEGALRNDMYGVSERLPVVRLRENSLMLEQGQ